MSSRRLLAMGLAALAIVALPVACADEVQEVEEPASAERDAILNEEKLYSQNKEELLIRHFFNDRRGGFFLDVGSAHWQKNSTTKFLEAHLGWSGVAIDALAHLAPGYAKHRKKTRFFNYAVTDHSGGTVSFYLAGELSSTQEDHLDQFEGLEDLEPKENQVEAITLNDLLDREGVTKIDFLSMDIEQGEPAALAGFDIERFAPQLICIEVGNTWVRERIIAYFEEHDYVRIEEYLEHDRVNWYYAPKKPLVAN